MSDTSRVSQILESLERGDPKAAEELLPLVYAELRQLAAARMNDERTGHTLAPTALVHEAYLRLVQPQGCCLLVLGLVTSTQPTRLSLLWPYLKAALVAMGNLTPKNQPIMGQCGQFQSKSDATSATNC